MSEKSENKGVSSRFMDANTFRRAAVKDDEGKHVSFMLAQHSEYLKACETQTRKYLNKKADETIDYEKLTSKQIKKIQERALETLRIKRENEYKQATNTRKAEILKEQQAEITAEREAIAFKQAAELAAAIASKKDEAQIQALKAKHAKENQKLLEQERKYKERSNALELSQEAHKVARIQKLAEDLKSGKDKGANSFKMVMELGTLTSASLKELTSDLRKSRENAGKITQLNMTELDQARKKLKEMEEGSATAEEIAAQEELIAEKEKAVKTSVKEEAALAAAQTLSSAVNALKDSIDASFKEAENFLTTYQSHIDARLQGSDKTFRDMNSMISNNLAISPYVKTQDVLKSMQEATDKGIVYNIEQRAFLNTIADKIANTFDAFDSNLTRLIRLQQADTTAARLGMEASLTKFFNGMFQDSSYLDDMYDSVSAAIIDANASMSRETSAEFEYVVQKWLGSLSSLGMSSETINQIATGINYLATGDVQSLANNTELQTLIAMSASEAGLSYSDMLIRGLDASSTNKLLESMVTYLKNIAENSDNQVVRAAYGDVFNLSLSDMKAISNLSAGDISSISSSMLTYGGMNSEMANQLSAVSSRISLAEKMSNLYDNATYTIANDLVNNPATYTLYKMLNFMESQNLDMNIPFINAFGTGLDLNTSVQGIMNLGLGLSSAFSLIGSIFEGLGSQGGLNLDRWGGTEFTQRGTGVTFSLGGVQAGTTGSTYISNASSSDMKNSSLSSATDDAEESSKITNKNLDPGYTIDDVYKSIIEGTDGNSWARVNERVLGLVHMSNSDWLHTHDTRMYFLSGSLQTIDTHQSYYMDGALATHDVVAHNDFTTVLGTKSVVTESGKVQVHAPDVVHVAPEQSKAATGLLVHINNASAIATAFFSTKENKMKVELDDSARFAIENAIKNAQGLSSDNTMQDMIDTICNTEGILVRTAVANPLLTTVDTTAHESQAIPVKVVDT